MDVLHIDISGHFHGKNKFRHIQSWMKSCLDLSCLKNIIHNYSVFFNVLVQQNKQSNKGITCLSTQSLSCWCNIKKSQVKGMSGYAH